MTRRRKKRAHTYALRRLLTQKRSRPRLRCCVPRALCTFCTAREGGSGAGTRAHPPPLLHLHKTLCALCKHVQNL
jgi:hypothetical protein